MAAGWPGGGDDLAILVLSTLAEAFAGQGGRLRGPLIRAAAAILDGAHANRREALARVLQEQDADELDALVLEFRAAHRGVPEWEAVQSVLLDLIAGRAPARAPRPATAARSVVRAV